MPPSETSTLVAPQPFSIKGVGGLTLRGSERGDERHTPVVLMHGGGQNRQAWRATASKLAAAGYFAVSFDARGHGDSDWAPDGAYGNDIMAQDLRLILERFERPPVVVGASMGGMTALTAQGSARTQLFAALVLVDVTPRLETEGVRRIVDFMTAYPDGFATLEEAADQIAAYNPHRERSASTDGLKRVLRERDGRWFWQWDPAFITGPDRGANHEMREAHMAEMAERLLKAAATLTVPTLLVRGAQSDVVSEANVKEFLSAVPHADYVDVSETGHMVAGDDNDAFTSAVLAFLKKSAI